MLLFSSNDFPDLAQLVQRFERSQVIQVHILDFIPNLAQDRIIQLEKAELIVSGLPGHRSFLYR